VLRRVGYCAVVMDRVNSIVGFSSCICNFVALWFGLFGLFVRSFSGRRIGWVWYGCVREGVFSISRSLMFDSIDFHTTVTSL